MDTKYLQEILELAERESSYETAEKLFISPSTLGRHVTAVEDEIGAVLFRRTKKGFFLTDEGRKFLPFAKKMLLLQAQCHQRLHDNPDSSKRIDICAQGKTIDLFIEFKKSHPEYSIAYHKCRDHQEELRQGKVEIAFLSSVGPLPDYFTSVPFYEEEVLVLVDEDHPLAARESVTLDELQDENFVAMCDDAVFDDALAEIFRNTGVLKDCAATVPENNDLLKMVQQKIGIALIHGVKETTMPYPGLVCISLRPQIRYHVSMCYRKDVPLSNAAALFVSFARRWIAWNADLNLSLFE